MKNRAWGVTGIACVSLIVFLAGIKYFEISSAIAFVNAMPEHSETVRIVTPVMDVYSKSIQVLGNTVVPNHVVLQNEISGIVAKVNRQSGAILKQDDIVIQLETRTEEAQIASAKARKKLAQSIYDRAKQLQANDAISQEQFDQAYADLVVIKSEIDVLKDTIRQKTIKAPFDGVLGIHTAKIGAFLNSNTEVVSITGDSGFVWVDFYVPQFYPKLAIGSEVKINGLNNMNETTLGEVIAVDDAVTASIRSRQYRAQVEQSLASLDANTAVTLDVSVSESTHVSVVPSIAVLSDSYGKYVYLINADESGQVFRAKRQDVKVLSVDAYQTMIAEGLSEGDLIAAEGAFKLFEGVLVNIADKNTASTHDNNDSNKG